MLLVYPVGLKRVVNEQSKTSAKGNAGLSTTSSRSRSSYPFFPIYNTHKGYLRTTFSGQIRINLIFWLIRLNPFQKRETEPRFARKRVC